MDKGSRPPGSCPSHWTQVTAWAGLHPRAARANLTQISACLPVDPSCHRSGGTIAPRPLRPGPHANAAHSWFHCPHGTDRAPGSLSCPRSHTGKKSSSEPTVQPCAQRGSRCLVGRGGRGQLQNVGRGLWSRRAPSHRHPLILLQGLCGGASLGQAAQGWPPSGEGPPAGSWGPSWETPSQPSQSPGQDGSPWKASPSLAQREGRCRREGPARSEQRPRARACRRVRTWQGCFQPCVYDDGGEELSAETLTQPGTSGVGAGWGQRGAQRGTEGWRRRWEWAGTNRASQQEGPGEGDTPGSQAGLCPPAHPPRPRSRRL